MLFALTLAIRGAVLPPLLTGAAFLLRLNICFWLVLRRWLLVVVACALAAFCFLPLAISILLPLSACFLLCVGGMPLGNNARTK